MADLALYTADSTGLLTFSLLPLTRTRGIAKLAQSIIVELVSDFSPVFGRGAGLVSALAAASPADGSSGASLAATAVEFVQASILRRQSGAAVPVDERLRSLSLVEASPVGSGWSIKIEIFSAANQSVVVAVPGVNG